MPHRRLRILVSPHDLAIGGSQINAIDLAAGVAAQGHEVIVYGIPGPLVAYIAEKGLRFVAADAMSWRPAPTRIAQLAALAVREKIDLIHSYEWPTCLEAYYGAHLVLGVPLVCTVLSMAVSKHVPRGIPLVMGTDELGEEARARHRAKVWVLEPPIDTARDNPAIDGAGFRARWGVEADEFLAVTVSRLSLDIKIDALVRAIDSAEALAGEIPIRLAVVGGGTAHAALQARAARANAAAGREVVTLVGEELDPRAAYAAADLVLGMGSSALRAMAIGRPVVVQGLDGFSRIFEPSSLDLFLRQGFFGIGDSPAGCDRLAGQIRELFGDGERRVALGRYGRAVVADRFSLSRAIGRLLEIYREVDGTPTWRQVGDVARTAWHALTLEVENHDPRVKRRRRDLERRILAAAHSGRWPPPAA